LKVKIIVFLLILEIPSLILTQLYEYKPWKDFCQGVISELSSGYCIKFQYKKYPEFEYNIWDHTVGALVQMTEKRIFTTFQNSPKIEFFEFCYEIGF